MTAANVATSWIIAPTILPAITAAVMILVWRRDIQMQRILSVASTIALLGIALFLYSAVSDGETDSYRLGAWPAPFGIVLVLDRLSTTMLVLTAGLALAVLLYAIAGWDKRGRHFHALFHFQLLGLNGAFLTGDIFNLFVFFEVMLAASYGLLLHGSGSLRVKSGLHYIAVNLAAALLFLIGVSLIYGSAGTLSMADLAARIPQMEPDRRMLMEAGAGVLGVAFLIKAGMWPLCFWLPTAYSAASAPVAGMFGGLNG